MTQARAILLIAAAVAAVAALGGSASAAAALQMTQIECGLPVHAGQFDAVWIVNQGDSPQDLAGWTLRSDPEGTEQMSLAPAGSLDPGEQPLIVLAGAHAAPVPGENIYVWSFSEILRDAGDPLDYVKLYDASGAFISGMDCSGAVLTAPAATPVPTEAPAQNPTTTQPSTVQPTNSQGAVGGARPAAVPKAVPNSGGATAGDDLTPILPVGAAALGIGVTLMILGLRGETIAARITSIEGERRIGPHGSVRKRSGRDAGGRS